MLKDVHQKRNQLITLRRGQAKGPSTPATGLRQRTPEIKQFALWNAVEGESHRMRPSPGIAGRTS